MTRVEKAEGVVLKRLNIGEADKIVTILTRTLGKISAKAPGIRRIKSRRAPHLEPFNQISLTLHRSHGPVVIGEARINNSYPKLRRDIAKIGLAFYICEVVDKLLPEFQPHPPVFDLLVTALSDLEDNENSERITKEFSIQLLWELGFLPRGNYPKIGVTAFVEEVIENKIKSRKFIEQSKYGKSG